MERYDWVCCRMFLVVLSISSEAGLRSPMSVVVCCLLSAFLSTFLSRLLFILPYKPHLVPVASISCFGVCELMGLRALLALVPVNMLLALIEDSNSALLTYLRNRLTLSGLIDLLFLRGKFCVLNGLRLCPVLTRVKRWDG